MNNASLQQETGNQKGKKVNGIINFREISPLISGMKEIMNHKKTSLDNEIVEKIQKLLEKKGINESIVSLNGLNINQANAIINMLKNNLKKEVIEFVLSCFLDTKEDIKFETSLKFDGLGLTQEEVFEILSNDYTFSDRRKYLFPK